jgi:hypothetical protein
VSDTPQTETKATGCVWWPGLLIWVGVAAAGSLLGWSAKTRLLVLVPLLLVAVVVAAARQQARDQSGGSRPQVPPGRPGPLSMGAGVEPSDSRPEPEPTRPEPEPPPEPTKPPEPEPPKPEATSEESVDKLGEKAERLGYRLGTAIGLLLCVAIVAGLVGGAWWFFVAK